MFNGNTFGEAVKKARKSIYDNYGDSTNTWGAYQCYGDPFYKLSDLKQNPGDIYSFVIPEEAEIVLSNLLNQLETSDYDVEEFTKKMIGIAVGIQRANISNGKILERQALLYSALGMYKEAIDKFKELIKEENASFSFSASEKYCNIRAKFTMQELKNKLKTSDEAVKDLQDVIKDLNGLKRFGCTNERLNILGSTYKRLAMVSPKTTKQKAYRYAADQYKSAYFNSPESKKFYPFANWLAIENALFYSSSKSKSEEERELIFSDIGEKPAELIMKEIKLREEMDADEMNFWDYAAEANLKLCRLLVNTKKENYDQLYDDVLKAYKEVWKFTGHKGNRQAEIEHLEFLEDAYGMANGKAKDILDRVVKLKSVLESIA